MLAAGPPKRAFTCVAALRLRGRPPHHRVAGSTNAPPAAAGAERERRLAARLRLRGRRGCASPRPAREPGPQGRQVCDCAPPPSAAPRARPPVPALASGNDGLLISGRAPALILRQMLVPRRERRRPPGVAGSPAEQSQPLLDVPSQLGNRHRMGGKRSSMQSEANNVIAILGARGLGRDPGADDDRVLAPHGGAGRAWSRLAQKGSARGRTRLPARGRRWRALDTAPIVTSENSGSDAPECCRHVVTAPAARRPNAFGCSQTTSLLCQSATVARGEPDSSPQRTRGRATPSSPKRSPAPRPARGRKQSSAGAVADACFWANAQVRGGRR